MLGILAFGLTFPVMEEESRRFDVWTAGSEWPDRREQLVFAIHSWMTKDMASGWCVCLHTSIQDGRSSTSIVAHLGKPIDQD